MKARSVYSPRGRVQLFLTALLALCGVMFGLNRILARAQSLEATPLQQVEGTIPLVTRGMETRISLDLRSTEATDALKYLATKGGLNIAISKNVTGRVNLFLTDVPIRDAFDLILRSNELAYDTQGTVYNVMTEAEYQALYGGRFADLRQVKMFRLQYAIPQQAFNLLDTLKSDIGRLLVDEDSGTVLLMDIPERLGQMTEALATLEVSAPSRVFDLQYAKAADIEARLNDQLEVNKLGYVKADERSNQLIVKTLPGRMEEIAQLITALDRKTREVLIDAKIIKITLTDKLDTGIDWNTVFTNLKFHGIGKADDFRSSSTGTAPSEVTAVTRLNLPTNVFGETYRSIFFGTMSRDGYELFRYLQTLGRTKIVSNPRLMVTENQEARIHVGRRQPYVTTTTTTGQTTTTTAEEVEFIDVGIQLVVTPTINADGFITMKIKPEVSSLLQPPLTTPSNNVIPIVETSTAETTVMVKDGTTVIIGGLRKNENKYAHEEIPFFARIPLIGELFRQRDRDDELAELVVFITPHIVGGEELVTGDEEKFRGKIRPYRDYERLFSE